MISRDEIMGKFNYDTLPGYQKINVDSLLERVNVIRTLWGKPLIVTSGYRDKADQIRIYNAKGITDESQMHMGSKHFIGAAVDLADPDGSLKKFVKDNDYKILVDNKLWMEAESATHGWLHVQIFAPLSGKREFMP